MLTISRSKLAAVIEAAQRFEAELLRSVDGLAAAADRIATDIPLDSPSRRALVAQLRMLKSQELEELLALAWIGRGDFSPREWDAAFALARDFRRGCRAECLATLPLLPDYLEEALSLLEVNQAAAGN